MTTTHNSPPASLTSLSGTSLLQESKISRSLTWSTSCQPSRVNYLLVASYSWLHLRLLMTASGQWKACVLYGPCKRPIVCLPTKLRNKQLKNRVLPGRNWCSDDRAERASSHAFFELARFWVHSCWRLELTTWHRKALSSQSMIRHRSSLAGACGLKLVSLIRLILVGGISRFVDGCMRGGWWDEPATWCMHETRGRRKARSPWPP